MSVQSDIEERVLGTLRAYGPMTTMELVEKTQFQYPSVYRRLRVAEKKGRVEAFRIGPGEAVMWSLNE